MSKKTFSFLFLAYLILCSGMATAFSRSVYNSLLLFVISTIIIIYVNNENNNKYYFACLLWFIYIIFSYFKYQGNNLFWPFIYFVNFTIIFGLIKIYGINLFKNAEKIIYFFTAISLLFYTWQIFDINSMLPLWKRFDMSGGSSTYENLFYYHSFFYTIIQYHYFKEAILPRNAGFCWEPGPFSCFIIIGLFLLLASNNFEIKKSIHKIIVYFLALLTTQSTTGILAFFVIAIWFSHNKFYNNTTKYLMVPLIVISIIITFIFIPILYGKINSQLGTNLNSAAIEASASNYSNNVNRFSSLKITCLEFLENPILGMGADGEQKWSFRNNININTTTGLGNFLAQYGLAGIIPFLLLTFKSSKYFSEYFRYKGKLYFFLIIIIIGISFNIIETSFFLALIMFSYFHTSSQAVSH